jgi:hypothetical protein
MASITITHDMFSALSDAARAELVKMFTAAPASAVTVTSSPSPPSSADDTPVKRGRKSKKVKKPVDPDAPPKEKRPPNDWILFSNRVEKVIREKELADGVDKDSKMRTVVVKQFASSLKTVKPYDEWVDADILSTLSTWTPPEVSKQAVAKAAAEAAATAPDAAATAPAADPAPDAAPQKKRGPKKLAEMTADERAAHDAKLADRKAKKAAAPAAASSEKDNTD